METFFQNMTPEDGTKQKLVQDLSILIHDAEDLIKATGGNLSEKARKQLMSSLAKVEQTAHRLEEEASEIAKAADRMIKEHPYQSIGVAFALGAAACFLLTRRGRDKESEPAR